MNCFFFLFLDIAMENFKSTDISFEIHVKDWFRHGTQRLAREKNGNKT
jgi:hypothetical protein